MKIYVINLIPSKININKLLNNTNLENFQKYYSELYSKECGQYILTSNKCIRIEPNFEEKIEVVKNYNNYDLLIDSTNIKKSEIYSQFPVEYIELKIKEYCFFFGNKKLASLKLIIRCLQNSKVIDYYFDYSGKKIDFDDIFFKEELNMLLSLLN